MLFSNMSNMLGLAELCQLPPGVLPLVLRSAAPQGIDVLSCYALCVGGIRASLLIPYYGI